MDKESRQFIANQYSGYFDQYGFDIRSLTVPKSGYCKKHQNYKFSILRRYIKEEDSVLDVGCGLSDLCDYLRERGWKGAYTGLDLSSKLVEFSKERLPNDQFYAVDILEDDLEGSYDHVISVSTIQQKPINEDAELYLKNMITKMFSIAQKTVMFDVFSRKFADFFNPECIYMDPGELLNFCYTLTNRLNIINDYNPYQLAVILYKEQLDGWIEIN